MGNGTLEQLWYVVTRVWIDSMISARATVPTVKLQDLGTKCDYGPDYPMRLPSPLQRSLSLLTAAAIPL